VDFGINARLTQADYVGVDLNPVRELKKAQDGEKVRAKHQPEGGNVGRGLQSLEQQAQALERASKKLETAGQTVHQVEDLLHDTLSGFRANRAENRPHAANERLLKSADETAADIVGFASFDEEALFPPSTSPLRFEEKKALSAYAKQIAAHREQRGMSDPPDVAEVIEGTREKLRGEDGVLPTLGELALTGGRDPDETDDKLSGLKEDMTHSRRDIAQVHLSVQTRRNEALSGEGPADAHIDVAS
jgi:hypothetical protein